MWYKSIYPLIGTRPSTQAYGWLLQISHGLAQGRVFSRVM
ncbi:hypothetical protein F383_23023 [Gossypium arboreum]|uniref:Uncharacterized protein n=1 Tax=Gossypium arboreum TaxID=29729 RepID=A0A0B0ML47_GOSAR|nr:hypothetical protein F383_23023 [Gossypium arboreum]